jgi:carbon-monoxide dehydrogenase large subunit
MATQVGAFGRSVKRREDPRFLRGKGTYIDDVKLPGMLYMDILRSPYAHATIKKIDPSAALAHPGVLAVITGKDLDAAGLAWMPTLMSDKQMVLPVDRVVYQAQEVAAVIATDRYVAADGVTLIEVDYEPLTPVVDPRKALESDAPLVRPDRENKTNHIWHWEAGDQRRTDELFEEAEVVVKQDLYIPRIHVSSIETCGCVASFDKISGKLTIWMTTQAPHAIRTVFSLVSGIPEHKIRVISPDIGGGFGGKVPVYPGYVIATVASIQTGRPIKWIEDRSENLQADSFARDYHISAELAANRDGTMKALRVKTIADHGAFDAAANPSKFPAGLFSVCTGSYQLEAAHVSVDGVYTNKPPGGVAYRCSFRVTEAVHTIERMVDRLAQELEMDPSEVRLKNFIPPDKFPYKSATGWEYDSGNYPAALHLAMEKIGYQELRQEQAEKRARGELMGIGLSTFTEIVGAGPSHTFDILGIKMFDSAEIRVHPTGSAIVRIGVQTQGQGHETTFAQIVAEELGLPVDNIVVEHGDTDTAPYGLGTYASRSTPTAGAATAMAARKIREKARALAAHLLEANVDDVEWVDYRFQVKGAPGRSKTMAEVAFAAYTNYPKGMEARPS